MKTRKQELALDRNNKLKRYTSQQNNQLPVKYIQLNKHNREKLVIYERNTSN